MSVFEKVNTGGTRSAFRLFEPLLKSTQRTDTIFETTGMGSGLCAPCSPGTSVCTRAALAAGLIKRFLQAITMLQMSRRADIEAGKTGKTTGRP